MTRSERMEPAATTTATWVSHAGPSCSEHRTAARRLRPPSVATRATIIRNLGFMVEKKPAPSSGLSLRTSERDVGALNCSWQRGQMTFLPVTVSGALKVLLHEGQRKQIMSN